MRRYMTWMLITSMLGTPAATYGAGPQSAAHNLNLKNVQLTADGTLLGQILTTAGRPQSDATIAVHAQNDVGKMTTQMTSDQSGRFVVTGLKTGVCVLSVGHETFAFRVWNHKSAPPNSLTSVALVPGESVARGQSDGFYAANA